MKQPAMHGVKPSVGDVMVGSDFGGLCLNDKLWRWAFKTAA